MSDDTDWDELVKPLSPEARDAAFWFADGVEFLNGFYGKYFAEKHPEVVATFALTAAVAELIRKQ